MTKQKKNIIRKLRAGDIRRLVKIIGPEIGSLKKATESSDDPAQVGIALFESILSKHVDDLWEWLADVAQMTVEEFNEQDLTFPIDVIRAIRDEDEFRPLLDALFSQAETDGNGSGTE